MKLTYSVSLSRKYISIGTMKILISSGFYDEGRLKYIIKTEIK